MPHSRQVQRTCTILLTTALALTSSSLSSQPRLDNQESVTTTKWFDQAEMVSASLLLTKRAVLLTQHQPKQQIYGIFSMSQTQLQWTPNAPDASQEVIEDVATISG